MDSLTKFKKIKNLVGINFLWLFKKKISRDEYISDYLTITDLFDKLASELVGLTQRQK